MDCREALGSGRWSTTPGRAVARVFALSARGRSPASARDQPARRGGARLTRPVPRALASLIALLPAAAPARAQAPSTPSPMSRVEQEELLRTGVVEIAGPATRRVRLDDGRRRHDAAVEYADGSDPTRRDFRFNVAAYELDKLITLGMVLPAVERTIEGRPASLTWWLDDFAMSEQERRRKQITPPDPERWSRQLQAVRVFDELISNTYRDTSPALYLNSVWDNLLITSEWTVWLIDHTGAFRLRGRLEDPDSLARCDRALLGGLRGLNRDLLRQRLSRYLSPQQLDALLIRRELLVSHFDRLLADKGEGAVLYDLARTR